MSEMLIQTVPLSSLYKIFPQSQPQEKRANSFSALVNEPLSFQVAYKVADSKRRAISFCLKIESDLPVSVYEEGYVPVLQASDPGVSPEDYSAGLFADMLISKKTNPKVSACDFPTQKLFFEEDKLQLHAVKDSWKGLWLTVNENERIVKAGEHTVRVLMYLRETNELCGECEFKINIIPARLPAQKLYYTSWFHCDCLCDTYGVEMFSERFWEIFRSFATCAAKHGMNTILTPCFTPSLDTPVGKYRKKAQLVGVEVLGDEYRFDFSLLKRFICESQACGIKYFEHSHFFTQWGAESAPQVWASVNGKQKRIFGWNTCAWGKAYTAFLNAYIPALLEFLKGEGIDKNFVFHISDEPDERTRLTYRKARGVLGNLLDGYICGDALSRYEFYEDGTVQTPIVATNTIRDFISKCPNLWAYYTGAICTKGYTNRKINHSSERNRMLGVHLYTHKVKGFLHWGYNFYYDVLSQGVFDPKTDPCGYTGTSPGTSFIVYPATDGTCIPSIRQKIFYESINDMRALKLLERLVGRRKTMEFVESYYSPIDFSVGAESQEKLLEFREQLNRKIAENVKRKVRK